MTHTESITISNSNLLVMIQRHLSTIGKRAGDKDGKNIFSSVTVSTIETPILEQYISTAVENVVAALSQFIHSYSATSNSCTFSVTNTRWKVSATDTFVPVFVDNVSTYIALYVVAEYLAMNHSDYAKKYYEDAALRMDALRRLVFYKTPADESASSYNTITGTILS